MKPDDFAGWDLTPSFHASGWTHAGGRANKQKRKDQAEEPVQENLISADRLAQIFHHQYVNV